MNSQSLSSIAREADGDNKELERSLYALRTHRSTFSPIARLPPELLSLIFSFLNGPSSRTSGRHPVSWPWQTVTYVSRMWRNVALGTPTLWTHIDFQSQTWTTEFLARSKAALLTVKGDIRDEQVSIDLADMVLKELPRTRELSLACNADILTLLEHRLTQPAPFLETLSLVVTHSDRWFRDTCVLPAAAFEGHASRLRELNLRGCVVDPTASFLSSVTHFHLQDLHAHDVTFMVDPFVMLTAMPRLQTLILEDAFPASVRCATSPRIELPHIILRHLTLLQLKGSVLFVAQFVQRLQIPSDTAIRISCHYFSNRAIASSPALFHIRRTDAPIPFHAVHFQSTCPSRLRLLAWTTDHSPYDNDETSANTVITFSWDRDLDQNAIIQAVCGALDISQVQSTLVDIQQGLSAKAWQPDFSSSQASKRVHLVPGSVDGLADVLATIILESDLVLVPR